MYIFSNIELNDGEIESCTYVYFEEVQRYDGKYIRSLKLN